MRGGIHPYYENELDGMAYNLNTHDYMTDREDKNAQLFAWTKPIWILQFTLDRHRDSFQN